MFVQVVCILSKTMSHKGRKEGKKERKEGRKNELTNYKNFAFSLVIYFHMGKHSIAMA